MAMAARLRAALADAFSRPTRSLDQSAKPAGVVKAGGILWVPVWLGLGIGLWFALPDDPGSRLYMVVAAICATMLAVLAGYWLGVGRVLDDMRGFAVAISLAAGGFLLTGAASERAAAPVLDFRYYGPVEGRLIEIDRSSRDRIRLTLDQPRLRNTSPERTPARVRVSLMSVDDTSRQTLPEPGARLGLTAHLGPPPGPAEPGGFDFRRMAWFDRLGAVGYTRAPVMVLAPPEEGLSLRLARWRTALAKAMVDRMDGQAGAVAAALMTGDRSYITEATNDMMRAANLYHIVSISGLHMAMLAGFVYGGARYVLVALQMFGALPLAFAIRKPAALAAIGASAFYLALSGFDVATERSFIMAACMLGAVLVDRRAISLRTIALAATVILLRAPESLLSPGFQMSFAATLALVLTFEHWGRIAPYVPKIAGPAAMLVLSSLVAGLATGPIAAATFGRITHYGILANFLVVPVMGVLVMPMGVIAALLGGLGLAGPALWVMQIGTEWMLLIGEWVASLSGATTSLLRPPALVLPLMTCGALVAALSWPRGREAIRPKAWASVGLGISAVVMSGTLWLTAKRPDVLISDQGDAVAVLTPVGRVPSKPKGGAFAVSNWLEADGDLASQADAAARRLWLPVEGGMRAAIAGTDLEIWHLTGKSGAQAATAACQTGRLVVTNAALGPQEGGCLWFDAKRLWETGALAIRVEADGRLNVTSVRDTGRRRWQE